MQITVEPISSTKRRVVIHDSISEHSLILKMMVSDCHRNEFLMEFFTRLTLGKVLTKNLIHEFHSLNDIEEWRKVLYMVTRPKLEADTTTLPWYEKGDDNVSRLYREIHRMNLAMGSKYTSIIKEQLSKGSFENTFLLHGLLQTMARSVGVLE